MAIESNKVLENNSFEQSFERAKQFANNFVVVDYNSVMTQLSMNARLTSEGQEILNNLSAK